jgi:hypothetical protein
MATKTATATTTTTNAPTVAGIAGVSVSDVGALASIRTGKVSATAKKAHVIVSGMSQAATIGAAIVGRGAVGKQARANISAPTLGFYLSKDVGTIDGGSWADLFGLLVQAVGIVPSASVLKDKPKARCLAYLNQARLNFEAKMANADTIKAQDGAAYNVSRCDYLRDTLTPHVDFKG